MFRDCSRELSNHGYGRDAKIEIELDVRNNGRNVSSREEHYGWVLPLLIIGGVLMIIWLRGDR